MADLRKDGRVPPGLREPDDLVPVVTGLAARPAEPIDCRWSARGEPEANLMCDPETDSIIEFLGHIILFSGTSSRPRRS